MITVQKQVNASIDKVWECWIKPEHIVNWNYASEDWHAPYAENNLKVGGQFKIGMAAKDGSAKFDFEGVYSNIVVKKLIEYTIVDGRKVSISFISEGSTTKVLESFEPETINTRELQQEGWQAILNNFAAYAESCT